MPRLLVLSDAFKLKYLIQNILSYDCNVSNVKTDPHHLFPTWSPYNLETYLMAKADCCWFFLVNFASNSSFTISLFCLFDLEFWLFCFHVTAQYDSISLHLILVLLVLALVLLLVLLATSNFLRTSFLKNISEWLLLKF